MSHLNRIASSQFRSGASPNSAPFSLQYFSLSFKGTLRASALHPTSSGIGALVANDGVRLGYLNRHYFTEWPTLLLGSDALAIDVYE